MRTKVADGVGVLMLILTGIVARANEEQGQKNQRLFYGSHKIRMQLNSFTNTRHNEINARQSASIVKANKNELLT